MFGSRTRPLRVFSTVCLLPEQRENRPGNRSGTGRWSETRIGTRWTSLIAKTASRHRRPPRSTRWFSSPREKGNRRTRKTRLFGQLSGNFPYSYARACQQIHSALIHHSMVRVCVLRDYSEMLFPRGKSSFNVFDGEQQNLFSGKSTFDIFQCWNHGENVSIYRKLGYYGNNQLFWNIPEYMFNLE